MYIGNQTKRVFNDAGTNRSNPNRITFRTRDLSLERIYSVLFVYFQLYSDYSFEIRRKPKFYELTFSAWLLRKHSTSGSKGDTL